MLTQLKSWDIRVPLIGLILYAVIVRFIGLDVAPPGFYIDESMPAAHSICYWQTGADLNGVRPLFSKIDFGSAQAAPLLMPAAVWSGVFGNSVASFRAFSAFAGALTLLALFFLVRGVTRRVDQALWTVALAACLPWAFHFSRIFWESPLATCFLLWGVALVFLRGVPRERSDFSRGDWALLAGAGVLLALAGFVYAPTRATAGLLALLMPGLRLRQRLVLVGSFILVTLPVLPYYSDPSFVARTRLLALTSDYEGNPFRGDGFFGLVFTYGKQLFEHVSPQFLLISGDRNLRHSIQNFGMLDWVTAVGILVTLVFIGRHFLRKTGSGFAENRTLLILAAIGVWLGITPAALTWEGIPHAIRSMAAWPFLVMLAGYGWIRVIDWKPRLGWGVLAATILCFGLYSVSYFRDYPRISQLWFDMPMIEQIQAEQVFPKEYGPVARAYYRMTLLGETCETVRANPQP